MAADDSLGELDDVITAFLAELPVAPAAGSVVAVGWATVETDRALTDFAARWPALPAFLPLPDDALLGSSAVGTTRPAVRDVRLLLVEPVTEGRMAASLARRGEGPVAAWIAGSAPAFAGIRLSDAADGPLGRERLVLGGALNGPHVLLLDGAPGTIGR